MKRLELSLKLHNVLLTLLMIAFLILLIVSLLMIMRSDPSSSSDIYAYMVSREPIIVLHVRPDQRSGVSTILEQGTRVVVEIYDPESEPFWAFVSRGEDSGWIQLEHLSQDPPS